MKERKPLEQQMGGEIFFKYKDILIQEMLKDEELMQVTMVGTEFPFWDKPRENVSPGDLVGKQIFPLKYTPEKPQEMKLPYITVDITLVRGASMQEVIATVTLYVFVHKDLSMIQLKDGRKVSRTDFMVSRIYELFDQSRHFGTSRLVFLESKPMFVQRDIVGTAVTFVTTDFARQYE